MIMTLACGSVREMPGVRQSIASLCRCVTLIVCAALAAFGTASAADKPQLVFTPFHADGIYALGEKVGWTVTPAPGTVAPKGSFSYTIKSNNLDVVKSGSFDLRSGTATVETTFDRPAMLYVTVDYRAVPPPSLSPAQYAQVNRALQALLEKDDPPLKPLFAKYPGYALLRPQFSLAALAENHIATLGGRGGGSANRLSRTALRAGGCRF